MTHAVAILLCILGFACLGMAMKRHQKDILGRTLLPSQARKLRRSGMLLLLVALVTDMAGLGAAYGIVAWCGHLTLGAAAMLARLMWAGRAITRQ